MANPTDSARRASRAEREAYMVSLVASSSEEGLEMDWLYGLLTKKWPGLSYRTYTSEYLKAAKARGEIHYEVNGKGIYVKPGAED